MGITDITDIQSLRLNHDKAVKEAKQGKEFAELIQEKLDQNQGVRFSKHASERIRQRGVDVSGKLLTDLNQAVEKARTKGAKDVVVIGTKGAFVVNVPNNTVITTMTEREMRENIFTNIDSAVLI